MKVTLKVEVEVSPQSGELTQKQKEIIAGMLVRVTRNRLAANLTRIVGVVPTDVCIDTLSVEAVGREGFRDD